MQLKTIGVAKGGQGRVFAQPSLIFAQPSKFFVKVSNYSSNLTAHFSHIISVGMAATHCFAGL